MSWRCLKTLEYAICLKSNVHVLQIVINDVSLNLTFKKYIYHQLVPALDDGPTFFVAVEMLKTTTLCPQIDCRHLRKECEFHDDVWDTKTLINVQTSQDCK